MALKMTQPLHSYGGLPGSVIGGTVPGVRVGPLSGWLGTLSGGGGGQELEMRRVFRNEVPGAKHFLR